MIDVQEETVKPINSKKRALIDEETTEVVVENTKVETTSKKLMHNDGSGQKMLGSSAQKQVANKQKDDEEKKELVFPEKDLTKLRLPSSPSYDPIADAPFHKGQPVPFGFVAKALTEIENCKGKNSKDSIKEIVANVFRSTMLLTPSELPDLFYFFCVKLGPDYEALETGIGLELLSGSVAKACGKSMKQIREQFKQEGDYGIVVEKGKGAQKSLGTFFKKTEEKPKPVTFRRVFEAF
jgi:hypothetical protein